MLEEFIYVLSMLSRGARVPHEYISYANRHRRKIYTRNDRTGPWAVKTTLPSDSPLLLSGIQPVEQELANHRLSSGTYEVNQMEQLPKCIGQEPVDGGTNMETSCENVSEGLLLQDLSDAGKKKRRLEAKIYAEKDLVG